MSAAVCNNDSYIEALSPDTNTSDSAYNLYKEGTSDENTTTDATSTKKTDRRKIINLVLFLIGVMCFKFSYETLSSAIALTVLSRLEHAEIGATTVLGILTILFGIAQSFGSTLVDGILRWVRPSRVLAFVLFYFACLVSIIVVLEITTHGTLKKNGTWSPWILFPIHINIGFCVGIIEVVRKIIPANILGTNASSTLKRLNSGIHICYEIAGTAGAFLSTLFIKKLGSIYALSHMPIAFFIGSVILLFITFDGDSSTEEQSTDYPQSKDLKGRIVEYFRKILQSIVTNFRYVIELLKVETVKKVFWGIVSAVKDYFAALWLGCKLMMLDRHYIWMIPCFVIPQVLHRIIENIMLPYYSKNILKEGSYSGIMLGGSNLGELLGAAFLFVFATKISSPVTYIRLDAYLVNLVWLFPFMPIELPKSNIAFALCMIPVMILISGSWAAGDISLVAYLQCK
jgi:uncharacterized membrane protein YeaQ/YmgE (transglycosylase-associated protein family)